MKRILFIFVCIFSLTGCSGFNPMSEQRINNQDGKIDEIRSNQNGVMLELGKLRQSTDIQNSQIKEFQQGMFNLNAALSKNDNSGIQILQGDGALILVFGLGVVGMVLYWYRDRTILSEKSLDIITKEVARMNDPILNDNILRAAMHTPTETKIFHLITKKQKEFTKH